MYAQAAAEYAWRCPTGAFASPTLERVVAAISTASLDGDLGPPHRLASTGMPQSVLHVLSRAEAVGGHTRLCSRWICIDGDRTHSVALTAQGKLPVPPTLARATARAHGTLTVLDERGNDLLDRARALRRLASAADLIVLHVDPHDVVPLLALADPAARPPSVFMNHADHLFWLGLDACDVVAHHRPSGAIFSEERRGVSSDRSTMLPLPLLTGGPKISRTDARKQLRIADGARVLLTVASAHKYAVEHGPSMLDLLAPVLERVPDCVLIAVGPRPEGIWTASRQPYAKRVRAVGLQDDTSPYLAAADIYLDSFPTTSLTSLLEAGQHGLPLLRLDLQPLAHASPLDADDPALRHALVTVPDVESYRDVLVRWLYSASERSRLGEAGKRSIEDYHCGAHWRQRVDEVYAQAARMSTDGASAAEPPGVRTDYDRALVDASFRGAIDAYFVRRLFDHCALLPPGRAVTMAIRFLIAIRGDLPAVVAHRRRIWRRLRRHLGRRILPPARARCGRVG